MEGGSCVSVCSERARDGQKGSKIKNKIRDDRLCVCA